MALRHGLIFIFKILLCLGLIYLIFLVVIVYLFSPNHDIFKEDKFNKAAWVEDKLAGAFDNTLDCQRGKMTQDLIENVLSERFSEQEVINLLGEPNTSSSHRFEYAIGWCGYIDSNSVIINFNQNNFTKAYIANH